MLGTELWPWNISSYQCSLIKTGMTRDFLGVYGINNTKIIWTRERIFAYVCSTSWVKLN